MTTIATGNRRLLRLAAFLEKLPRKRFDYGRFVGSAWRGAQDLSCGTTACALGWACTMPEFRRLGLRLSGSGLPTLGFCNSLSVGMWLFAAYYNDSRYLFDPDDSGLGLGATPKQVAKHIRKFVKERS